MALRFTTAGESHGPGLTAVLEGLPAGLELAPEDIDRDLARRQLGHGRGGRMKIEKDRAEVRAGVRHGRTLGSPVAMWVENRDYANWEERMNPWPVEAEVAEVHLPRPGVDESPVRSLDADAGQAMVGEIDAARRANESLGGVFEVWAFGLVPGLGSYVSWDERLDGALAQAIMSIQAMKGVSIGDGFAVAGLPGSQAHDEIFFSEKHGYFRETNRAGGLEGGMTTGEPLIVRGAMKPLPTLTKPLRSVDTATKEPAQALRERTDSCTVPAAAVVAEAMAALVVGSAYREKFGGDHIDDALGALRAYTERIQWRR